MPRRCPGRVGVGGMWYYKLSVSNVPGKQYPALVLERVMPDLDAVSIPSFDEPERSVLADDIKSFKVAYFGRDRGVALDQAPTWRNRWDDTSSSPCSVQIEVVPRRASHGLRSSSRRGRPRKRVAAPGTPSASNASAHDDAADNEHHVCTTRVVARCFKRSAPGRPKPTA